MVFRYWGDRHADVQQFESLVDSRAGGIADTALVDAIRARGWNTARLDGSLSTIQEQMAIGHPLILLIEDRPSRYHYVVAVGSDAEHVFLHDPTWGPSRRMTVSELHRRWKPTGFWTLLVTKGDAERPTSTVANTEQASERALRQNVLQDVPSRNDGDVCERLLDNALDTIEAQGPAAADAALEAVGRQCPTASGPSRELAAVRFSQRRWRDAATLAERATMLNKADAYAWDVLGSSRFILDDGHGALDA